MTKKYRTRNWPEYNAGLIKRGRISVWIKDDVFETPVATSKRGRPKKYADGLIELLLTFKSWFKLSLRSTQGFWQSLLDLYQKTDHDSTHYTTLCRRQKSLEIARPQAWSREGHRIIAIDSTGLKIFGEGEWFRKMHGKNAARRWRKIHCAIDANTGQILAQVTTGQETGDASMLPALLDQLSDIDIDQVCADGAYDSFGIHADIESIGAEALIPPRSTAVLCDENTPGARSRNSLLNKIKQTSLEEWKTSSGYHKRSLVENAFYRFKQLTGAHLAARCPQRQIVEVDIRVKLCNHLRLLTRPTSMTIA